MMGCVSLAALSLAYWLAQVVLAWRCARHISPLSALRNAASAAWPRLSVVVPARDEEADIASALTSKLSARYPNLEIVAVDDRSTDRTGAIMDALAEGDARLRVAHVGTLPEGWLGKLNALQRGLEDASGEWILFSDADVHFEGDVLERVIAHAELNRLDFVGVLPGLDPTLLVLDPVMLNFMRSIFFLGRMWLANDDQSSIGVGVGAFSLVRRSALGRTPGLAHLRFEIADDVAFGAMMKACGHRCRLFAGRRDVHLIFYSKLTAAAHSWEKFGTVFEFTLWRPVLFVTLQLALEIGFAFIGLFVGGLAAWVGLAALSAATLTFALLTRHFALRWRGVALWPLGSIGAVLLILRAAYVTWRAQGIRWRGVFYPAEALLRGRRFYAGSIDLKE